MNSELSVCVNSFIRAVLKVMGKVVCVFSFLFVDRCPCSSVYRLNKHYVGSIAHFPCKINRTFNLLHTPLSIHNGQAYLFIHVVVFLAI